MSTITGLISGGGSGGGAMTNIFTDPTFLMRSLIWTSQLRTNDESNNSRSADQSQFWSQMTNNLEWYPATLTAANTYVTLADISSATNGGFLYNVLANACTGSPVAHTSTIKITVDGTAYEFTGGQNGPSPYLNCRFTIGMFLGTYSVGVSDYENYDPFSTYWNYNIDAGAVDTTNNVYGSSGRSMIPTATFAEGLNLQKVRFESSIKVEVKSTSYFGGGSTNDKAVATIRLL